MNDIWRKEVIKINNTYFLTAGDWAPKEKFPTIHVGYLAPYAHELFAQVDHRHPWEALVNSSYKILEWSHSGFNIHNGVEIDADDDKGKENLAQYIIKAPISQERMI